MDISMKIKILLMQNNIKQAELGKLLNTTQQSISLKLKKNDFKLSELRKISELLNSNLIIYVTDNKNLTKDITSDLFKSDIDYKINHLIEFASILGYEININL